MSKKVSNISLYNHITIALLLFFLLLATITTMSSNCASVGDIVCVSPRSHNGKMMVTGHATIEFWNNSSCREMYISAEGVSADGTLLAY